MCQITLSFFLCFGASALSIVIPVRFSNTEGCLFNQGQIGIWGSQVCKEDGQVFKFATLRIPETIDDQIAFPGLS